MLGIGRPIGRRQPTMQHWDDLVREVEEAGDLRVCISNEDFAKAAGDKATRVVDELGGDRVHVLAVARRLDRLLPSWWQERVKARLTMSYEEWLELVLGPESKHFEWRNLWVSQDFEKLVDRWTRRNGPESFTFVVSDDSDQQLLPRTIEGMLGLPAGPRRGRTGPREPLAQHVGGRPRPPTQPGLPRPQVGRRPLPEPGPGRCGEAAEGAPQGAGRPATATSPVLGRREGRGDQQPDGRRDRVVRGQHRRRPRHVEAAQPRGDGRAAAGVDRHPCRARGARPRGVRPRLPPPGGRHRAPSRQEAPLGGRPRSRRRPAR